MDAPSGVLENVGGTNGESDRATIGNGVIDGKCGPKTTRRGEGRIFNGYGNVEVNSWGRRRSSRRRRLVNDLGLKALENRQNNGSIRITDTGAEENLNNRIVEEIAFEFGNSKALVSGSEVGGTSVGGNSSIIATKATESEKCAW